MLVHKCNFLQLLLKINAIFSINFLVQQKLALIMTFTTILCDLTRDVRLVIVISHIYGFIIIRHSESVRVPVFGPY